jgi:septum formation topological specificity factor MinE
MVSFQNQSDTAVTIPAGTVVSTSTDPPVRFRTLNSVRLPARAGSTVQVPIRAEEPGPEGNVPAFAIDTLDPRLGLAVAVVNERPTEGGTTREIGIVTAEERARVRDALLAQLRREALDVLETQLQSGEDLVADTAQVRVIEERYGQEVGAQSDVIEVELTIRATALAVAMAQARELAASALRDRVPAGYTLDDDTLQARVVSVAAEGDGVRLQVTASAVAWAEVTKRDVRNAVRGQPINEAIVILERDFELADRPEIQASRVWLDRMPWLPLRIDVILVRSSEPQT